MIIKGKAICDRGVVRSGNEDHILVNQRIFTDGAMEFELNANLGNHWFAVADGMGGHHGGEVASRLVLENLREITREIEPDISLKEFDGRMFAWLMDINASIKMEGELNTALKGMGTTLSGVFLGENSAYIYNAGDSRVYLYRKGLLEKLTRDHTLGESAGRRDIRSHLLVNCIGPINHPYIDVDDISREILPGTVLLICSDGLTEMIDGIELLKGCETGSPDLLVEKACSAGGRDNISLIWVEFI